MVLVATFWCTTSAEAQVDCAARAPGTVDDAVRAYEEADFETAYALFDSLILGADLTRADLIRVYATRALLRFADGDSEGMLRDLAALASLEPEYQLGPRAPPPVHEAFDGLRGGAAALALEVRIVPTPLGARIETSATGDRADIVRAIVVGARATGGTFRESTDGTISVTEPSETIEYYARIVGPGGATLAERGDREHPHIERVAAFAARDDTVAIVLGTSGAVLAVAAAVVITVVLTTGAAGTDQVIGPTFDLPSM